MERPFRDDDREKPVITSEGRHIGTIRETEEDRATVDRSDDNDSLTDEIKDMLGWNEGDDILEIRREHVGRYEDDKFYLRPRR